jgi:hypothetical protein
VTAEYVPTADQRALVEYAAAFGITQVPVCVDRLLESSVWACAKQALANAGVPLDRIEALGGWSGANRGASANYGGRYPIDILKREIDKIEFAELKLPKWNMVRRARPQSFVQKFPSVTKPSGQRRPCDSITTVPLSGTHQSLSPIVPLGQRSPFWRGTGLPSPALAVPTTAKIKNPKIDSLSIELPPYPLLKIIGAQVGARECRNHCQWVKAFRWQYGLNMGNELIRPIDADTARAIEASAKLGIKVLDSGDKAGGYATSVLGSLPHNLVGIFGDWVYHKRIRRLADLFVDTKRILDERGIKDPYEELSPSIAVPLLDGATDETREHIKDLWANLLAAALDPNRSGKVRLSFISTLKQFDPIDALVLKVRYERQDSLPPDPLDYLANYLNRSPDEIAVSAQTLQMLKCFEPASNFHLTAYGRELMRRLLWLEMGFNCAQEQQPAIEAERATKYAPRKKSRLYTRRQKYSAAQATANSFFGRETSPERLSASDPFSKKSI